MKTALTAFMVGLLFGIGLCISTMTQPQKVVGFLDFFGSWDISLLFVMVGAISVHFITYRLIRRRETPILVKTWQVPTKTKITPALIAGSILFGIGWGLGGYCPGPALTSLASFDSRPAIFVVSMLVGMFLFKLVDKIFKIDR